MLETLIKLSFLSVQNRIPDNHLSQYMEVAKVNNNCYNNAKNTDLTKFFQCSRQDS